MTKAFVDFRIAVIVFRLKQAHVMLAYLKIFQRPTVIDRFEKKSTNATLEIELSTEKDDCSDQAALRCL